MRILLPLLLCSVILHAAEDDYFEIAPVVVNSELDKTSTPLVAAPGSFVRQENTDIKRKAPRSLRSSLTDEPNIHFTGSPRGHTEQPQIRGLNSKRILILDEGVRQNFQAEHSGRVFSDYSLLESVEVVKGPWSSLYGSGAMGGIVSLRRATAGDLARRTGLEQGAEVAVDGASNAHEFGQRVTGFAKKKNFEPLISYHHSKGSDVKLGNGNTLPYSGNESYDYYSSLGLPLGERQFFELKLNHFERRAREPLNPEGFETAASQLGNLRATKQDVVGSYRYKREDYDFHFKPYFRNTKSRKSRVSDGRADSQSVQTLGFDTWGNLQHGFSEDWVTVTTLGTEIFRDKNIGRRGNAALANFPDGRSESLGIYLQPQFIWKKKWKLTPGIRHDRFRSRAGANKENEGTNNSAKLYGSYEFSAGNQVFAGWGQAFNAPRLQDLYVSGLHFPGSGSIPNNFFQANPDLKPEQADTAELGYKGNVYIRENLLLAPSATYFVTEAKDFIARDVNETGGTTRMANLERVRLHGFEANTLLQSEIVGFGLGYGQVRSKNKQNGNPLTDTPADQWTAKIEWYLGKITAGSELKYAEAQTLVPSGTNRSAPYFLQDAYLTYTSPRFNATLRANNVHNKAYRTHTAVNLDPGRDIRLTAGYAF